MKRLLVVTLILIPLLPNLVHAQSLFNEEYSSFELLLDNVKNFTAQLSSIFNFSTFLQNNSGSISVDPNKTRFGFLKTQNVQEKYLPILLIKLTDESIDSLETLMEKSVTDVIQNTSWLKALHAKEKIENLSWAFSVEKKSGEKRKDAFSRISNENKLKFPLRSFRAPKNSQTPDLSTIIKIEFENKNADTAKLARELKNQSGIIWAEPDSQSVPTAFIPNDPEFPRQWALNNTGQSGGKPDADMDLPDAWPIAKGNNVTIAIIDTGIDLNHPDLKAHLVPGYDFVDNDSIPQDEEGHGTAVAQDAAAIINNGIGTAGVAGEANIMPLRESTINQVGQALVWATDHGADVINLSLWGPKTNLLVDGIRYAYSHGVVIVAAVGNEGMNRTSPRFPADFDEVIAVGGTDKFDNRFWWANVGSHIDVVAPAVSISSLLGGAYVEGDGTSTAAPYVSGIAALLLSANPNLTLNQVISIIKHSADDLVGSANEDVSGWDPFHGWGRVNATKALSLRNAPPLDPPRFVATPSSINLVIPSHSCNKTYTKDIKIQNIGSGPFNWSATDNASWLTLTPSVGTSSSNVAAAINATNFTTGSTSGASITFAAPGATNSSYSVLISGKVSSDFQLTKCDTRLTSRPDYYADQLAPSGIQTEDGGVVIGWTTGYPGDPPYAQKWNESGVPTWSMGGVRIGDRINGIDSSHRSPVSVITDGQSGAIFIWNHGTPTTNNPFASDIFIQKVDQGGVVRWGSGGTLVQEDADFRPPVMVSDGFGGAIVAWATSNTSQGTFNILMQRFSSNGQKMWASPKIIVQDIYGGGSEFGFRITTDGAHGAIITFAGFLPSSSSYNRVYVQRVSASGTFPWGSSPIVVNNTEISYDLSSAISNDGSGGALIAWHSGIGNMNAQNELLEILAQRINASGARLWGNSGVKVTGPGTEPRKQIPGEDFRPDDYNRPLVIERDGDGGMFVSWKHFRTLDDEIYTAHINSGGTLTWRTKVGSRSLLDALMPTMAYDGAGGVLVAWFDQDGGTDQFGQGITNLFMQRIKSNGALYETAPIQITSGAQVGSPQLIRSSSTFRFIWTDYRHQFSDSGTNIYTQSFTMSTSSISNNPPALSMPIATTTKENQLVQFVVKATDNDGNLSTSISGSGMPRGAILTSLGDLDGDRRVTSQDVALLSQYTLGAGTLTAKQKDLADLSGNGILDSSDVALLTQASLNKARISRFRWIPSYAQAGTYSINFSIQDAAGLQSSTTTTLTVIDVPLLIMDTSDSPDPFSPNGDRVKDTTTITLTFNHELKSGTVQFINASGNTVRTYSFGSNAVARVTWNGKDAGGLYVPDGTYIYVMRAADIGGSSVTSRGTVVVDARAPSLSLRDTPDPFNPQSGTATTTSIYIIPTESGYVTLSLYNNLGTLVRTLSNEALLGPIANRIFWDGKTSQGTYTSPGTYTYKAWFRDLAGNAATTYPTLGTISVQL